MPDTKHKESVNSEAKHSISIHIEENSFKDDGDGIISFPLGQVISDDTVQRNGTAYDIPSMDISEYNGTVTADHMDMLQSVIAKTLGLAKRGNQLIINGLQFAVQENPLAQLGYDLMRGGYVKDMSIETYGAPPDETGKFVNAKLCGLSVVVTGNNKSATLNNLVQNSLATARKNGLDTTEAEKALGVELAEEDTKKPEEGDKQTNNKKEDEMSYVTIKNSRDFAIKVKYKNASDEDTETELAPGTGVDVSEEQKEAVEKQVNDAKNPADEKQPTDVDTIVNAVNKGLDARLEAFEKSLFDKTAKEPVFKKSPNGATNKGGQNQSDLEKMSWKERTGLQIQSLHSVLKGNQDAAKTVNAINSMHLEKLQQDGKASNALTLSDLGNFVIAPEMVTEISGHKSNYRPLLDRFRFSETLSLTTSWIERTGEIQMEDVEMEDDGANGDLKPISQPTYDTHTATLKEFAAVTPVDASAIRFSAVDIVEDITSMYRQAYDRALAQSVVGRLEKAIESNGNTVPYNFSSANGGETGSLVSLIRAWAEIAEHTPNGVYLMTMSSYLHLMEQSIRAGVTGPLASIFTQGPDGLRQFLGLPYVIVPSDLLPNLNTAGTKSWTFEGTSVTVNHGVILADPTNFKGRVSGGLNFQVSSEASYEEGGSVKSAFQRDKLVFRGYGYRKSAITNTADVAGVSAPGIS